MNIKSLVYRALGGILLVLVVGGPSLKEDLHFWNVYFTGKHAVAPPVHLRTERRGRYNHYTGTLRFVSDDGVPVAGGKHVPLELAHAFEARLPVPVRYNDRNPSDFVMEGERAVWPFVFWGVIFFLLVLGFAVVFVFDWYTNRPVKQRVKRQRPAKPARRREKRAKRR